MLEDAILHVIHANGIQTSTSPERDGWRIDAVLPEIAETISGRGATIQEAAIRLAIALDIDVEE